MSQVILDHATCNIGSDLQYQGSVMQHYAYAILSVSSIKHIGEKGSSLMSVFVLVNCILFEAVNVCHGLCIHSIVAGTALLQFDGPAVCAVS